VTLRVRATDDDATDRGDEALEHGAQRIVLTKSEVLDIHI
jgi:hypothetical protein